MLENDDPILQGLFDSLHITGVYSPRHVSEEGYDPRHGTRTAPGNRAYYRKGSTGNEYIYRTDVWSDSQNRFVLTRWYPEIGYVPYLETEYNES